MKKHTKKFAALLVAFAMVFSLVGTALAADGDVEPIDDFSIGTYKTYRPQEIAAKKAAEDSDEESTQTLGEKVAENFDYLSGATAAANTPVLSILGINVTSTDAAGALNAGGDATAPMNLLVFGSELNENPDPYLWNFYYNLGVNGYPGSVYSYGEYTVNYGWTGAYTLLNEAKSGPTGGASSDKSRDIYVDGVYKNCDPVFFYEPDVLLGSNENSYDYGLSIYQTACNSNYNPLQVGGWGTGSNQYALNDGTFASTVAMADGVYQEALDIVAGLGTSKTGRYGDIVDCGVVYSSFGLGLYYYAQSLFDSEELTKLRVCVDPDIAIYDGGYYTVTNPTGRTKQYLDGLVEYTPEGQYKDAATLKKDCDVVLSSNLTENQITILEHVGITVLDPTLPDTVYGMSMQAPDNILGSSYMFALLYSDQLAELNIDLTPDDVTAYFVDNIYHVNSGDDVLIVLDAMKGYDLEKDENGNLIFHSVLSINRRGDFTYNDTIKQMIIDGATYYKGLSTDIKNAGRWNAVDDANFDKVFS